MSQLASKRQRPASLFGPIVLIAIGLFLLFTRLYPETHLHWLDTLRLWPLLLVFLGLNVIALQAPRPYASLFSGFLSLVAVLVFGYVLFNGLGGALFGGRFGAGDWQSEPIHFSAADVETAAYDITIDAPGADLYALEDSRDLLAGTITYEDDYSFDTQLFGSKATISLAPKYRSSDWGFLFNRWREYDETDRSQLGISRNVLADLKMETIAGRSHLDLSDLSLESLTLAVNAGEVELILPAGDYDAHLATNAGTTEITLPDSGRQTINVAVNAGSITLHALTNTALHVEVDRALGAFNAHNAGLRRVAGQENVWETADYAHAKSRVDLSLHISVGSVTID